jgi:hypothetical protein
VKASTEREVLLSQDSVKARVVKRTAILIVVYNILLVAWVLLKPGSDVMLAAVVNMAQFVGPLLDVLYLAAAPGRIGPGLKALSTQSSPDLCVVFTNRQLIPPTP